ncbi:MAG: hypothetical protein R3277_08980 [Brumimicrobium sp.]|nr:hypothetical protein [Brumimicrobium sp.]
MKIISTAILIFIFFGCSDGSIEGVENRAERENITPPNSTTTLKNTDKVLASTAKYYGCKASK